jgi:tRNA threonylcarbamoyladenosine biosynthesis protein TsaE
MATIEVITDSPEATRAWGATLGEACRGGEVLLLEGPLGTGKTCLVQGLARGLDVSEAEPVTSPTFVLHAQYAGRLELNHIDAYRLAEAPDASLLGFDELCHPGSVVAIEWPEFLPLDLPGICARLSLEAIDATRRRIRLCVDGAEEGMHLLAKSEQG